jgi:hypothetical protein
MKKGIVLIIGICMICVNISGIAVSVKEEVITPSEDEIYPINLPTESYEVNEKVLKSINQEVEKYLDFKDYDSNYQPRRTVKDINFPWYVDTSKAGDFVDWIIHVNYKEPGGQEKYFQEEIIISPLNFRDKFLEHPWHYEKLSFDTNEDGIDDIEVYYSVFISMLTNIPEGIDTKSVRTCLKVRTEDMLVRDAKLEVWSELKFNFGLIREISRSHEKSFSTYNTIGRILYRFVENIFERFEATQFTPFMNLWNRIFNQLNIKNLETESNLNYKLAASDTDWLAMGIGVVSPEGEKIPLYYEKYLNVAKNNIFSPMIFEHELKQVGSQEPLGLLFGFQAGHENQGATNDVAFEIDFDPAIHIRTQFVPRNNYVYYYFDTGSGYSKETRVSFTTNGFGGDNVELSLIFDDTTPLSNSKNWMSFDIKWLGFDYRANKKHTVSFLLTSPSFSTKLKLKGVPTQASFEFDADLSFEYQQGQLLDVEGTGSLELSMNSNMDDAILYYPELSSEEPKIEFVKVSSIPKSQSLSAHTELYIHNGSMTTIRGVGYVDLSMSESLGSIKAFYRKADPADPNKLFIDIPYGIPASQRVGAEAELYMDLDDFSNINNYVYARGYRTASGNLQEISGYLPGALEPIVSITEIPSNSEGRGKLEWNRLRGYAYAFRTTSGGPDPIDVNIDIGTFNIKNHFELRNGHLDLRFHLNEDGYFYFDTSNNMIADLLRVTDTSSGDQLKISADNVDADQLNAEWNLDLSESPIQIEDLAFSGALSLLENFVLEASYQGEYLNFDMDWKMGQEGQVSFDFSQDEPIEIVVDDLFQDDPTWDVGGGVIIDQDFHFDIKWKWIRGSPSGEHGYFKINEDTNNPNFDWIGFNIEYTPDGEDDPQYGIEVGGYNVGVIVFMEWYKDPDYWKPFIWWYIYITGNFYMHLLWEGEWYYNVDE